MVTLPFFVISCALLVLLSLCLLSVAWVAWRRPVLFKLGIRNIPRRRAQSILIVVGVALDTMKQLEAQLMMRNYEGFLK